MQLENKEENNTNWGRERKIINTKGCYFSCFFLENIKGVWNFYIIGEYSLMQALYIEII